MIGFNSWCLLNESFEDFPEGPRRRYAIQASMLSRHDKNIVINDEDGKVVGIASVWKEPDVPNDEGIPDGMYIKIRNMAVKEKGLGVKLFEKIKKYARSQNAGILLNTTEGAEDFYIKLGMHRGTGANYYLTFDEI